MDFLPLKQPDPGQTQDVGPDSWKSLGASSFIDLLPEKKLPRVGAAWVA